MNIFKRLAAGIRKNDGRPDGDGVRERERPNLDDGFGASNDRQHSNGSYLYHSWVNIAVNILIRNIARADFTIRKNGAEVTAGPVYGLFHRPNGTLSRYDLWKETAAWWFLEGEAFWWYGPDYGGGIPREIYVLDPRRMRHEGEFTGEIDPGFRDKPRRWFLQTGTELLDLF